MAELSSVSQDLGLGWGAQPHADFLFDVSGPLASIFTQRAVVILQSVASGRTLSIDEGDLSGRGIRNEHSQFVVRIRPERKVSFNNSADPLHWLSIFDGKAIGDGNGGPYSEFYIREVEEKYVVLESVMYPGQYLGVCEDGEMMSPKETGPDVRGCLFIPFPHSITSPLHGVYADDPPPYPGPSIPDASAPPPYMPPAEHPDASPMEDKTLLIPVRGDTAKKGLDLHTGAKVSLSSKHPPTEPTTPYGYVLKDLFHESNEVNIIPYMDVCGYPLNAHKEVFGSGCLKAGGEYPSAMSTFHFVSKGKCTHEIINCGLKKPLCITENKKVTFPKSEFGGTDCEFVIHSVSGAIVSIESALFPGYFLSMTTGGLIKLESQSIGTINVQFVIRVKVFKGPYTKTIKSPFDPSKTSVVDHLKDGTVIQLCHKPTMTFLCLLDGGRVGGIARGIKESKLVYRDRGMGRVSLIGYYKGILKFRMVQFGRRIESTGPNDLNTDFMVKECPDGTIQFESVPYESHYLQLKVQNEVITSFSVFS